MEDPPSGHSAEDHVERQFERNAAIHKSAHADLRSYALDLFVVGPHPGAEGADTTNEGADGRSEPILEATLILSRNWSPIAS